MATKKKPTFSAVSSRPSLAPWIGIAFIVILLDQISKITIVRLFVHGEEKPVTSFFNLVLAYNPGAAFSFLSTQGGWQRYFFAGIAIVAVGFILYLLRKHAGQRMFCWALALIMGGALGNLIDRLMYGHVIDFLDFYLAGVGHFPAFNIADTAITIGAILFIVDELRRVNKH
ncbi:signal peptidase II [uncultured Massilia sp.]|uniref:signal peptidase II n=1 Tax=uncultured Massilia sp. TaxID=169973 RepID=UPI002600DA35|nr:signal peptidase II [uncultured Massilia sp.]